MVRTIAKVSGLALLCLLPLACQEGEQSVSGTEQTDSTVSFLDFGFNDTTGGDLQSPLTPEFNRAQLIFTCSQKEFVSWFYECPLPTLLFKDEAGLAKRRAHFLHTIAQGEEARALSGDFRKGERDYYCQVDVRWQDRDKDLLAVTLRLDLIEGSSFQEVPILE